MSLILHSPCVWHYCSRDFGLRETHSKWGLLGQTGWITLSCPETTTRSVPHCNGTTWTDFNLIYTTVRPQRSNGWSKHRRGQKQWFKLYRQIQACLRLGLHSVCPPLVQLSPVVRCPWWEYPRSPQRKRRPSLPGSCWGLSLLVLFSMGGPPREAVCKVLKKIMWKHRAVSLKPRS